MIVTTEVLLGIAEGAGADLILIPNHDGGESPAFQCPGHVAAALLWIAMADAFGIGQTRMLALQHLPMPHALHTVLYIPSITTS